MSVVLELVLTSREAGVQPSLGEALGPGKKPFGAKGAKEVRARVGEFGSRLVKKTVTLSRAFSAVRYFYRILGLRP
jgi:hypothetical protein